MIDPKGMVSDPVYDHLFLVSNGDNTVDIFQESTITTNPLPLRKLSVGRSPFGIGMVNAKVYVANFGSASVSVISTASMTRLYDIPLNTCGGEPAHLAVNPNTNLVYVALHAAARVAVIDATTDSVIKCIPVTTGAGTFGGTFGIAVHPASNTIFVGNRDTRDLWRIDGYTHIAAQVPNGTNGGAPYYIGVSNTTDKLFMMVGADPDIPNDLYVYDIDYWNGSLSNQTIVRVGNTDDGGFVIQSQCSGRIYIAETFDNSLRILNSDLSLYAVITPASGLIDGGPFGLLENVMLRRIYVSNKPMNTLSILNECPGPLAAPTPARTRTPTRTRTPSAMPTPVRSPTGTATPTRTATATVTRMPTPK